MKNLRRLALVAGVATLSAVAFSPKAQAQTANVDFSSTIPATCNINSTTNGTLALTSPSQFRAWGGGSAAGTPGKINVSCNTGTTFTINSITNNGTPAAIFSNLSNNAAIFDPSGGLIANFTGTPTSALQAGPIANQDYRIDVTVTNQGGTALPIGNYGIRVNISLAPQ